MSHTLLWCTIDGTPKFDVQINTVRTNVSQSMGVTRRVCKDNIHHSLYHALIYSRTTYAIHTDYSTFLKRLKSLVKKQYQCGVFL